jgi:hypothetical protein
MKTVELQYKTFDELMADVNVDFQQYNLENMIDPQQLIRVAGRVNYDLGIQITKEKEAVIDICNYKGRLPSDFQILNYAYLCGKYTVEDMVPSGTHIEDVVLTPPECKQPKLYYYFIDYVPCTPEGITTGGVPCTPNACYANDCFNPNLGNDAQFGLVSYVPLNAGDTVYIQYGNNKGLCIDLVGSGFNTMPDANYPYGPIPPGFNWKVYTVLQKHSDCAACKQRHNQYNNQVPCGDPIQNVTPVEKQPNDSPFCMPQDACMNKCGDYYQLIQKVKYTTRTYTEFMPIYLKPGKQIDCDCPNTKIRSGAHAEIKDGFINAGFENGTIYINYQALMQDDDGNLLVLDHPMITEYYEYALKERILENLLMNGETGLEGKIQLIVAKLRIARINALSIVRTPNFSEMKRVWKQARDIMYRRFYDIIN